MKLSDKRSVAITGVNGFTGSHLADHMSKAGWDVFGMGFGNLKTSQNNFEADLSEIDRISDWLSKVKPKYIIHLAAQSHVVGNPLDFYQVNVLGTENLLRALIKSGVKPRKIILASSANVYGNSERIPTDEMASLRPLSHYALSKAAMETMASAWVDRFPIIITRPFNYTGPGQSEKFLIPKMASAFARRQREIKLGNINIKRDISHISFICNAYEKLATSSYSGLTVNLCSGKVISISSVISVLEEIAGYKIDIISDKELVRANDIYELQGNDCMARQLIGEIENKHPEDIVREIYYYYCDQSTKNYSS